MCGDLGSGRDISKGSREGWIFSALGTVDAMTLSIFPFIRLLGGTLES
jgi:hypothetical protein